MRKTKKILGLLKQLDKLLEESADIFFEERPFLLDRSLDLKIDPQDEKREENELKIQKTVSVISREIPKEETKVFEQSLID